MSNRLSEKMKTLGIILSDRQIEQFEKYYSILSEWNKVMNLTAITEYDEVIEKHFVDSLAITKVFSMEKIKTEIQTMIDIGTGAGIPGIPLKIVFPHLKITLLDSLNKRIKFLNEVICQLDLKEIHTIHGRAEDFAKKTEYRESYDICVSRAVANLSTLSEYCLPYVKKGGIFLPYKSGNIEQEIKDSEQAISLLGGKIKDIVEFELPDSDIQRSLILIKKIQNTNKKYPRKAGTPAKEPL